MLIRAAAIIAVAGVTAACPAYADQDGPSLFGIALGQSVAEIPVCPFIPNTLHFHGEKLCLIKSTKISKAWGAEEFNLNLPPEKPSYLLDLHLAAVDGRVVEVVAGTHGLRYQDDVQRALSQKFGKPASAKADTMQNSFGAKFKRLRTEWRLKTAVLTMYGAESSADSGAIYLSDREYAKRVADYTKAREGKLKP